MKNLLLLPTDIAKSMLEQDKSKLVILDEIELQNMFESDNKLKKIKDLYENVENLIVECQ